MAELDRVTGGGFVPGSVLLIGGEPGIGKSTLLIQACAALARRGERVVYISGEEAAAQVRLRAERLGLADAAIELAAETSVEDIIATLSAGRRPRWSVIEFDPDHVDRQRRGHARHGDPSARRRPGPDPLCQDRGRLVVLVGHVTKDGRSPARAWSSIWSMRWLTFEGDGAATSSASCAASRTALARPTRSACSK